MKALDEMPITQVMTNLDVSTLSDKDIEAIDAEIAKLYGTPVSQQGNAALDSLFKNFGSERRSNTGKKIISGRAMKKMIREDIPFEDEYVYMQAPDGSVAALPARKYTKYIAEGRKIVDDSDLEPQKANRENTREKIWIGDKSYSIFFCSDKYDCQRFFDSERGRNVHWKTDHEGAWSRKAKNGDKNSVSS